MVDHGYRRIHGGVNSDPSFRECLIRWFQFATFSPVLRMHGDREPRMPLSTTGGGKCVSGAPNELWSFGEEAYGILKNYLRLREWMRPYIRGLMSAAHTRGHRLSVRCFTTFPRTTKPGRRGCLHVGPDVLVAPSCSRGSVLVRFTCLPENAGSATGVERSSMVAKSSMKPPRSTICPSFSVRTERFPGRKPNEITDGQWLLQGGVTAHYAAEARSIAVEDGKLVVLAPVRPIKTGVTQLKARS